MEALWIVMIYGLIAAFAYRKRDRTVDGAVAPLCLTCMNAVVARGTGGQEWVACNYGGAMRPVKFTVCECTAYCGTPGTSKLVKIEGFAREKREVYSEAAISRASTN
jgi:hypothetical protein